MIEEDLVECFISLGKNLFYNSIIYLLQIFDSESLNSSYK